MGQNIANREIQLTIQGQTVSSNFGTIDAAQYNMEQLIHAGIHSSLILSKLTTLAPAEEQLLQQLATLSQQAYLQLKEHPNFVDYLMHASPLRYYADTNIGSRPAKRGAGGKLTLKDLRAIPFVGSWSQLKQNVTGYYGLGTALEALERDDPAAFAGLQRGVRGWRFLTYALSNIESNLASRDTALMRDYAALVTDREVRESFLARILDGLVGKPR